jgi:inorganic pyrophosphatase
MLQTSVASLWRSPSSSSCASRSLLSLASSASSASSSSRGVLLCSAQLLQQRSYTAATIRARQRPAVPERPDSDADACYFVDESQGGAPVSPWHDVPLAAGPPGLCNFVCEIPSGLTLKYRLSTAVPFNPIVPELRSSGQKRVLGMKTIAAHGVLPQTYESPEQLDARTGCAGDGEPLDVLDISLEASRGSGSIYPVKVLGALPLIEGGRTHWKVREGGRQRTCAPPSPSSPALHCAQPAPLLSH